LQENNDQEEDHKNESAQKLPAKTRAHLACHLSVQKKKFKKTIGSFLSMNFSIFA
jgi:hypothetical protein